MFKYASPLFTTTHERVRLIDLRYLIWKIWKIQNCLSGNAVTIHKQRIHFSDKTYVMDSNSY